MVKKPQTLVDGNNTSSKVTRNNQEVMRQDHDAQWSSSSSSGRTSERVGGRNHMTHSGVHPGYHKAVEDIAGKRLFYPPQGK